MEKASPLTWERVLQVLRDARGTPRTVDQVGKAILGRAPAARRMVKVGDLLAIMADAGVVLETKIAAPVSQRRYRVPEGASYGPCPECGARLALHVSSSALHGNQFQCQRCGTDFRTKIL